MVEARLKYRTFYEAEDNGGALRALGGAGLLPPDLELAPRCDRAARSGKAGMIKDLLPLVNPVGGAGRSAIAVRDLDDRSPAQMRDWFVERITAELTRTTPAVQVLPQPGNGQVMTFRVEAAGQPHVGRIVVVPVGRPDTPQLRSYGITRFSLDDYVLPLAQERAVFESIEEFKGIEYDTAMKRLAEAVAALQSKGILIDRTAQVLDLLRDVTGGQADPATLTERLVRQALDVLGREWVRELFGPVIEALEAAWQALSFDQVNEARARLIYKKYHGGLTAEESLELERLQQVSHEFMERAFPHPRLSSDELALVKEALGLAAEPTNP
jgi:hypothetical protein